MIETISIKWDLLGAKLARLSDEDQGKFFTGFAKELGHYESMYKAELQLAFANGKIPDDAKKILEELLPMLWHKDE